MTRRPGRYLLRLLVVMAVVAAVVGVGYLWRTSSSLASIVADGRDGRFRRDRGRAAFSLGNISDLLTTLLIGTAVMCSVIVVDKVRRRRRKMSGAGINPSSTSSGSG